MITGQEKPDSGEVEIGQTVKLAYVDQSRDALSADKTVFEEVAEGRDILTVGRYEIPSRAYLGRFTSRAATSKNASAACRRRARAPAYGENADRRRQRAAAR